MNNEKSIKALNTLIQINNDRIEGYKKAAQETKEPDLKQLFSRMQNTSEHCRKELSVEVSQLGGIPTNDTNTTGKFYRAWMEVKNALTSNDRKSILSSCEYGEDAAVETYENELKDSSKYLSSNQIRKIETELELIRSDHDEIKSRRDELLSV